MESLPKIDNTNNYTQLVFENQNNFNLLVISNNCLDSLKWSDPDYLNKITNLDVFKIITTSSNDFLNHVVEYLDVNTHNNDSNVMVQTQLIAEFPDHIYELIYINNIPKNDQIKNDLATLLITNGETIYGNVLLLKTFVPITNTKQLLITDSSVDDIKYILENRIKTKAVIYDGDWKQIDLIGPLEDYVNDFFENESYLKYEIPFLSHNINIWYQKLDGATNKNICGKLLDKSIYKCIWFTMISDEYRGSLTLNEVEKIIKLSYHLEFPYKPLEIWTEDEKDNYDRSVIKNKYRILEMAHNHFFNKNI